MKKLMALLIFTLAVTIVTAQYLTTQPAVYSASEQKAINLSKQNIDCIWGDCVNGKGRLLVTNKFSKNAQRNEERYSIEGEFKDGFLNGFGKITLYYGKNFPLKKAVPFDSLEAVNEIYNSLDWINNLKNGTGHEGSFGFFKNGVLLEGTCINGYRKVMAGIFYRNELIYGSIKEENAELEYKGFTTSSGTGLAMKYKKDSVEFFPHRFQQKITDFRPLSVSEYNMGTTSVIKMPFENGLYSGEVFEGLPEGLGEWIGSDHQHVKFGYFKKGKLHGLAALNFSRGDKYNSMDFVLGEFKNGVIQKASVTEEGDIYVGEVNEKYLPDGYGTRYKKEWDKQIVFESGNFSVGNLNGHGTRRFSNGNTQSGNFNNGTFTSGDEIITVNSLRKGDVVKVNGKKLAVIEEPWDEHTFSKSYRGWVILSDKTKLKQGMPFEKLNESNDAFYMLCPTCGGRGIIDNYATVKVLVQGGTYSTYQQYTGTHTAPKEVTVALSNPVYENKVVANGTATCSVCNGKGKIPK